MIILTQNFVQMKYALFIIVFFNFLLGNSQTIDKTNVRPGEEVEYCTTHKKLHELLKNPEYQKQFDEDQRILEQQEAIYKASARKRGTVYTIPVVFHVLHSGGSENISDEQIYDAMRILNRDFRLQNTDANEVHADFKNLPSDVEVEFKLASIAPNGTCFKGITRTYSTDTTTDGSNQIALIKKGNDVYKGDWAGNKYMNIYVCSAVGGAAGYTYRPYGDGVSMMNGIWLLHTYVGGIGTSNEIKSRALTHEVGHWLNLMHTWGGNNNPGNPDSCNDPNQDRVDDTPATMGVTWCNLNENTCGPRANVENYMDYSYCSKMFTPGQVSRMRTALQSTVGGRNNVCSESNLIAVGALNPNLCKVDFNVDASNICSGTEVTFTDLSYNNVTSRKWLFPGGTPSESTDQNPKVIYSTPGKYNVSLTVSNGNTSLNKTYENLITVQDFPIEIPYLQSFKNISSVTTLPGWIVQNPDNNQAFKIYNGVGYTDSTCLYLNNYLDKTKSIDALVSSAFNLSNVKSQSQITLTFKYAYRKLSKTNDESLRVYLSNDCGKTWSVKRVLSGTSLDTNISQLNWKPTSKSDWKSVNLTNISSSYWNSSMRIKFEFTGNGGNNFYLDDINLYPSGPVDSIVKSVLSNSNYSYKLDSADIHVDNKIGCLGNTVSYSDLNASNATQWKWSFTGGYPTSSIEQNPKVTYSKPGVYNVSLTIGNGVSSKVISKTNFVTIDASKRDFPISENFDTLKSLNSSSFWSIYPTNSTNVELITKENLNKYIYFKQVDANTIHGNLISKQLNFIKLKDTSTVKIWFDILKSTTNKNLKDTLFVYLSEDCGENWNQIKSLNISDIGSNDSLNWQKVEISNFDKNLLKQFSLIKFDYKGEHDLFLDHIEIFNDATSSLSVLSNDNISLYPNPVNDKFIIKNTGKEKIQNVVITDIVGKVIFEKQLVENIDYIEVECSSFAKGSYYVSVYDSNLKSRSTPIIIQ
jgi:PKD repeat protein